MKKLEPGSEEWAKVCREIKAAKKNPNQPFCGQAGGRSSKGLPCKSPWVLTNGRCNIHGGLAKRGVEHPRFKHGRNTVMFKNLPERFKAAYMASIEDDDLLSLRADIAVSDARVVELLERLDTGESTQRWQQVGIASLGLLTELKKTAPDLERLQNLGLELVRLADKSRAEERSWRSLRTQTNFRRKLVDSERQRLKDLHAYLTAEEALAIVARLVDSIIRHVEDKSALGAIMLEVERLTGNDPAEMRRDRILQVS